MVVHKTLQPGRLNSPRSDSQVVLAVTGMRVQLKRRVNGGKQVEPVRRSQVEDLAVRKVAVVVEDAGIRWQG